MITLDAWLDEYSDSHRNPVNKVLHWLCVPSIVLAVLGGLAALPGPWPGFWAMASAALAILYWVRLSWRLALGMVPVLVAMALAVRALAAAGPPLWASCLAIFAVAWVGQFIGHAVEGRRPSFFKDVQFLLIGPLWLLAATYRALGWRR